MQSSRGSLRRRLAVLGVTAVATVGGTTGAASCSSGTGPVLPFTPTTTGAPIPPPDSEMIVVGRPLRGRRGRLRLGRSRRRNGLWLTDAATLSLSADVRAMLADHWQRTGEMEHASVLAFTDLSRRLSRVRASDSLIQRARQAADQEREHAQRCFQLASRYAGRRVTPGRLWRPVRRPRGRSAEVTALAIEALRDGVVNEGYAAWLANAQLDRASDSVVRTTLAVIAADEAEHAELSRDVLAWCLLNGDEVTRQAVNAAYADLPQRLSGPTLPRHVPAPARSVLAAHGLVDVDPDGVGYRRLVESLVA